MIIGGKIGPASLGRSNVTMVDRRGLLPVRGIIFIRSSGSLQRPTYLMTDKAHDFVIIWAAHRHQGIDTDIYRRAQGVDDGPAAKAHRCMIKRCRSWHINSCRRKMRWQKRGDI